MRIGDHNAYRDAMVMVVGVRSRVASDDRGVDHEGL